MSVKEFFKKSWGYIVAFFVGIFSVIGTILSYNRRTTDRVREGISDTETTSERIGDTISDVREEVSKVGDTKQRLEESNKRTEEIINQIRKQRIDD